MKNLIAELLVNLAQKEEEAKELTVQVEALEIVVTGCAATFDSGYRNRHGAGQARAAGGRP